MVHVYLEEGLCFQGDTRIQALSWMGKVPDMLPNEDGLKLDRDLYYQEGWLASGNSQGIVGVTFTSCHGMRSIDAPNRVNYNLTGHRNEVVMVRWNEPYQKLVTCDDKGVIFVWIRHEGRWSIELINDRHRKVMDFSWSHDGRMAVICYEDGFVLVGSVGGQRYWSSTLNLDETKITTGVWTPDDEKILLGTSNGQVIVMGSTGAMLNQFELIEGMEMASMAWSCEKFNMEDGEEESEGSERARSRSPIDDCCKSHMLAVSFKYGAVLLMSNYDDVDYKTIHTGIVDVKIEWSNDGDLLACGGFLRQADLGCENMVKLYCKDGNLKKVIHIPNQTKPLTALTWGHSDRRLFISAGNCIYAAWVTKNVPSLQMICRDALKSCLREECSLQKLPLPLKVRQYVRETFEATVQGVVPVQSKLLDFVTMPPIGGDRYYCTMIKHDSGDSGDFWTLYLEHMGGLFPLLKARKSSKLRPEFVIFDPVSSQNIIQDSEDANRSSSELSSFDSDTDTVDIGCGSPKSQRRQKEKRRKRLERLEKELTCRHIEGAGLPVDGLPEKKKIVEVSSNIWGTKFRIVGCAPCLPRDLGQVVYKSSLLHLQPRQMSLAITEINGQNSYNSNESQSSLCSEEEEEVLSPVAEAGLVSGVDGDFVIVPEATITHAQFAHSDDFTDKLHQDYVTQGASASTELLINCDNHSVQCNKLEETLTGDKGIHETDCCCGTMAEVCSECNVSPLHDFLSESQGAIPKMVNVQSVGGPPPPSSNSMDRKVRLQSRAKDDTRNRNACKRCNNKENATLCSLCRSDYGPIVGADLGNKLSNDLHNMKSDFHRNLKYIDDDSEDDVEVEKICDGLLNCISTTNCVEIEKPACSVEICVEDEEVKKLTQDKKSDDIVSYVKENANSNGFKPITELQNKNLKNSKFVKQGSVGATEIISSVVSQGLVEGDGTSNGSSSPSTPTRRETLKLRSSSRERQLNKSSPSIESSDDEILLTGDEMTTSYSYRDLESFQKAQLKQKMRKGRSKSDGERVVARRQFIMHNKAPLWNENSQVYQLDFGGRVTQESAKNFQIEFRGKQVMQFGRIDLNKYTLDFQYPFSGIQAFAVALANVTQRLK